MPALTIVYDTATPQFKENRVLDPHYASQFPGILWLPKLSEHARARGWEVMTADVYLAQRPARPTAVCVSDMVTPYTYQLLASGVTPAVLLCAESPNVAWNFYHRLAQYARPYRVALLFGGTCDRVKPPTCFQALHWPNDRRDVVAGPPWEQRDLLVMIASNKQRFDVTAHKPLVGVRRALKRWFWYYLQFIDPLFRFEDFYQKRLEALQYFASRPGFCLYGMGWDQPVVGWPPARQQSMRAVYAGAITPGVTAKREAMRRFKYALCFENCAFPGYVTEKIFDCFLAGCIPIYLGAPDITDLVPSATFVDYRKFAGLADLEGFVRALTVGEAQCYLEAARDFLASSAFGTFHQDAWVNGLLELCEKDLPGVGGT